MKINVGILLSYDYEFLKNSLPTVYNEADTITLALDENLTSWSGETFSIDPEFFSWLERFDTQGKIKIYRDNFYDPSLNTMQNDTRERTMLTKQMGSGWNIQLDSDEYFINFKGFVQYLRSNKSLHKKPTQICPLWITLFRRLDDGVLYIRRPDPFVIGSNAPKFTAARKSKGQFKAYVPFIVLHQSWARTEEELDKKLRNWSHNDDFNVQDYITFWKNLSKDNYQDVKDFHPLSPTAWNKLDFIPGRTMEEIITNISNNLPEIDRSMLFKKNLGQKIKHLRFF